MKKLLSLLAIAALIMLCGCSKSETDPEAPENSFDTTFTCRHCGQEYIMRNEPFGSNLDWYNIYAIVDDELILVGGKCFGARITIKCIGEVEHGVPCNFPMPF